MIMQSKKILTNVYLHDIVNNVVKHGGVSEWFKELVLKTSDLARDQEFESLLLRHFVYYIMICFNKFHCFGEILKWWRGSPAKGVGRVTGARVQIPLSPPKVANLLGLAAFLFLLLNCKMTMVGNIYRFTLFITFYLQFFCKGWWFIFFLFLQ